MKRVFLNESGQTGTHLSDSAQPYFALASTDMPEDEASALLAKIFAARQGPELKAANLFKYAGGRRQFIELAKEFGARSDHFCAAKLSKRWVVVSKMADQLVEPLLRDMGYDFYKCSPSASMRQI